MEERINKEQHEECKISIVDTAIKFVKSWASKFGNALVKFGEGDPTMPPSPVTGTPYPVINTNTPCSDMEVGIQPVGRKDDLIDKNPIDDISEQQDTKKKIASLYKFVDNSAKLINEYDRYANEVQDENIKILYRDSANKIIENMILSGCTSINPQEDEPFDFSYHTTEPVSVPENKRIKETIRLGVVFDSKVQVKAIVILK